jgi:LPXTG-motif cell wall-anchored protein
LNVSSIEPAGATDDLPETGGPTLVLLVGGALLISSGLLARRVIL